MSGRGGFDIPGIADRIHSIPVDDPGPGEYRTVPIGDVEIKSQVREVFDEERLNALKAVIDRDGQRQPVECYYEDGRYILLTGERRYRAVKDLGKEYVEVKIRKKPEPIEAIYLQVSENEDREPLTRIEFAKAISALHAAGERTIDIAKQLGIGSKQVPRYRTVGTASQRVHEAYYQGVVNMRCLELLAHIDKKWSDAFDEICSSLVSGAIRDTELESIYSRLKAGEDVSSVVSGGESSPQSDGVQQSGDVAEPRTGAATASQTEEGSEPQVAGAAESQSVAGASNDQESHVAPPPFSEADEGASQGDTRGDASSERNESGEEVGASSDGASPNPQGSGGINIDHHYEASHTAADPRNIVIEVQGKLDNGTQIRGTILMDRVDEMSEYVWVKPDVSTSEPVKLLAKRVKIVSVTAC